MNKAIALYITLAALLGIYTGHVFTDGATRNTPAAVTQTLTPPAPVVTDQDCWDDFSCAMTKAPGWARVDQAMADTLAEGEQPNRDWISCFWHEGDTSTILCPDGYTETS
jgi:hypothetical protein